MMDVHEAGQQATSKNEALFGCGSASRPRWTWREFETLQFADEYLVIFADKIGNFRVLLVCNLIIHLINL